MMRSSTSLLSSQSTSSSSSSINPTKKKKSSKHRKEEIAPRDDGIAAAYKEDLGSQGVKNKLGDKSANILPLAITKAEKKQRLKRTVC
jgi:hypothetical protein